MRAALPILVLVAASACGSRQKQTENLLETSIRFQEGLRWGRFEDAASHVPPAEREAFLDEHDKLSDELRIDDYEVIRVHFKSSHEVALVQVKYTWHLDGEGIVKETVTDQKWELHGTAWWMSREVLKRGEAMPGLPKKAKTDPESEPEEPVDSSAEGGIGSRDAPL